MVVDDDIFLGSTFNLGEGFGNNTSQMPSFPNGLDLYRRPSYIRDYSLFDKCYVNDIQEGYFSNGHYQKIKATEISTENNVSLSFVRDMTAFVDRPIANGEGNNILEEGEKELFKYIVKVFVSTEKTYLEEAFNKALPAQNEVLFFLEDNSTDIFSPKAAFIKVGSDFQNDLSKREHIAKVESTLKNNETGLPFLDSYNQSISKSNYGFINFDFSASEISELITKGEISHPAMTVLIGLYQLANLPLVALSFILAPIGDGLLWITATAREYIEFKESSWNPYTTSNTGEITENKDFKPYLLTIHKNILDFANSTAEEIRSYCMEAIKDGLQAKQKEFKSNLSIITKPIISNYVAPEKLTQFIDKCFFNIEQVIETLFYYNEQIIDIVMYAENKLLNVINAFLCGLWNSIVEIILGIIDLIGYACKLLGGIGDAIYNAQTLGPQLLELMDEAWQTFMQADIVGIISELINKTLERIKKINLYTLTDGISIESVAYFIGGLAGMIVEQIIDAYCSGGTKNVADLFKKFGTTGKNVTEYITKSCSKLLKEGTSSITSNIIEIFKYLLNLLKEGKEKIGKLVDEFFELIEKGALAIEEFIMKLLKINGKDINEAKLLGITFTEIGEDFCKLCNE